MVDRTLSALASAVCAADPRTTSQRRADALAALATGRVLACRCEQADCPARTHNTEDTPTPAGAKVVINVVAPADTVTGDGERPGYLEGYGVTDADQIRQLAADASQRLIKVEDTQTGRCATSSLRAWP